MSSSQAASSGKHPGWFLDFPTSNSPIPVFFPRSYQVREISKKVYFRSIMEPVSSVRILQTEARSSPSTHIAYQLSLQGPVRSWTVWRRYSDFDNLHKALLTTFTPLTPPAQLPSKSIFPFLSATGNDPAKIEERRRGLETYAQAILFDQDPKWRRSKEWMDFIGLPPSDRRGVIAGTGAGGFSMSSVPLLTPEAWMEEYRSLQSLTREIKSHIAARDRHAQASDTAQSQSATLAARKSITALQTRSAALEQVLKSQDQHNSEHSLTATISHVLHLGAGG